MARVVVPSPFDSSKGNLLLKLFDRALIAVDGRVRTQAALHGAVPAGPVYVLAVGKAAAAMALGAYDALGPRIVVSLIVTKDAHGRAELDAMLGARVLYAGHPLPDERSLAAGQELLKFAKDVPADACVLVLVSGGASSLAEALPPGVDLEVWRRLNRWGLESGHDIVAVNSVRRALSRIKGGRLIAALGHAQVLGFAISDVPGDDPAVIGSGLLCSRSTLPPPANLPAWIEQLLAAQSVSPVNVDIPVCIVARLEDALAAAAEAAAQSGLQTSIDPQRFSGEAGALGERFARAALAAPGRVHLWGGESTVTLPNSPGLGGRAQHLALSAARILSGQDAALLSAGTDGTDGASDAAGALIDGGTVARIQAQDLDVQAALIHYDSGSALCASGDLIDTGATGTNVGDVVFAYAGAG